MQPIFVSGCGLGSAIFKIIHAAYIKPKLLHITKHESHVDSHLNLQGEEEDQNYYMNKVNSEPKSSLLRRKDKTRVRARTESQKPANEVENNDSEDDKKSVNEFFKKPKHKKKK